MKKSCLICFFSFYTLFCFGHSTLSIGAGGLVKRGINTREFSSPLGKDESFQSAQTSPLLSIGYTYAKDNAFYGKLDFQCRGYQSKSNTYLDGSDLFYQLKFKAGYTFDVGLDFTITPTLGLSKENSKLEYKSSADLPTNDAYVTRDWICLVVGLNLDGPILTDLKWGVHLEVLPNLQAAKLKSNVVDAQSLKLDEKINYIFSLPLTYNFPKSASACRLTPFYESENFGSPKKQSDTANDAFKNYVLGAQLEYIYQF